MPSSQPVRAESAGPESSPKNGKGDPSLVMDCNIDELFYGTVKAVRDTKIPLQKNVITALIGPSGCGKSTVLRCMNRMNDLIRGFRFEGYVNYRGKDIYGPTSIPWQCAATSGWCSSSRTLSPPASITMSRLDCG